MYNWITRRKIARTEGPNYPALAAQTVGAVVATWIPVTAALLSCAFTPARPKLDVRSYDWQPSNAWIKTSIPAIVPPTVAQTVPAFSNTGGRTDDRARLDARRYDWDGPETEWLRVPLALTAVQYAPAVQYDGERTPDRARLDVRRYEWVSEEAGWIQATQSAPVAPTVAQTAPAFTSQAQTYRTPTPARPLDLFRAHNSPDFGIPDDWITWVPQQDDGGRTRDRARLDVRSFEWSSSAWITTAIPVVTAPTVLQTMPAVQQLDGDRTAMRARLDVRRYEWAPPFTWVRPVVDATVAKWAPVFRLGRSTDRTPARARLDVRRLEGPIGPVNTSSSATSTYVRRTSFWRGGSRGAGRR